MVWFDYIVLILFVCLLIYGVVKQVQKSMFLHRTDSTEKPLNKKLLLGNHLYSFMFIGFACFFILNIIAYLGVFYQTQKDSNDISLFTFLFLLAMFILKFAVIPKQQSSLLHPRKSSKSEESS